ncbi:MAG: LPP20 family lipoprotein [Spirochaetales bacterium]|nr:LPP20 family lipoprotein [Spirochaetales bacterium]
MKKTVFLLSALMALVILAGCASSEPVAVEEVKEDPMARRDLPDWFLNPPVSDEVIYGLGMAKMSSDSLSRDTAIARARRDVATQVSTRVQSMMTDYAQEAGAEGNTQTINFVESITKQVADVEIKGSITEKVYAAVDGNWFAMVSYEKSNMAEEVADIFSRNEDAAFAEFKADQALEMLEASIANDPLKSSATAE